MSRLTRLLRRMLTSPDQSRLPQISTARCPDCRALFYGTSETQVGLEFSRHAIRNHTEPPTCEAWGES